MSHDSEAHIAKVDIILKTEHLLRVIDTCVTKVCARKCVLKCASNMPFVSVTYFVSFVFAVRWWFGRFEE